MSATNFLDDLKYFKVINMMLEVSHIINLLLIFMELVPNVGLQLPFVSHMSFHNRLVMQLNKDGKIQRSKAWEAFGPT